MEQGTVQANGVTFTYLEAGPPDGPLALCLHGFPDSAHTWRHLLPRLAEAGYHGVAPWMRGYAPTSLAPDGAYQTGALAADANALHEALGGDDRSVVIGHDWGAAAAYGAAGAEPTRWRRAVTMAVPPLSAMASAFFSYAQLKRSFYIFFFQSPLAEAVVGADDCAFIDGLWADWSPGYDAGHDLAKVKEAIGAPDRLAAAIGYYRAMFDPARRLARYDDQQSAADGAPPQPTLYLHGASDGCLALEAVGDVASALSAGSEFAAVADAGHFLHLEQPDEVNRRVLSFLKG